MDSYLDTIQDKQMQRDYGIQIRFIQDPQEEATKAESHRTANSKAGSYGVSIRVQGIDGQPYVVLNSNQEGQMQMYEPSPENGCFNPTLPQDDFKPYSGPYARKPRNTASTNGHFTFPESQHFNLRRPSPYLPLLRTETPKVKDDNSHVKAGNLLNFQKHPEILKPYIPEKRVLEQAGWQRLTSNVTAEKNIDSPLHHKPKPEFSRKLDAGMSNPVKASDERNRISKSDQTKRTAGLISRKPDSGNSKGKGRNGTSADLEDSRTARSDLEDSQMARPDLLPLHRQRPGGRGVEAPVLHRSFSTTAPAASDNKLWVDDPDEELSAENINRHENRRYIPFFPGTGRDIDSDHIPGVDELIDKFDGKEGQHRRGRSARRNRIDPEDRKRSRSVDSVFPLKSADNFPYSDRKFGATSEHLLRPSQLRRQSAVTQRPDLSENPQVSNTVSTGSLGRYPAQTADRQGNVKNGLVKSSSQTKVDGEATNEPRERTVVKSSALSVGANNKPEAEREEMVPVTQKHLGKTALSFIRINKKGLDPLASQDTCDNDVPVTPDLLKDQQTNEETAKQILYNYLKEGSQDDDATKKKVNLVFEKIQTLKSKGVAAVKDQRGKKDDISSEFQVLLEQKNELEKNAVAIEKKAEELQRKLDEVTKIQQNDREQKDRTKDNLRNLQREMEENIEENNCLREQLAKSDKELRNQLEELVQVKMEREQYQSEIRDLQDQLSEMHDELDCAKFPADNEEEKETLMMEMIEAKRQLEEVLIAKEDQQEMLRRRERELTALRGVLKEEVSNHDRETEELKEQHEKEKQKLKKIIDDLLQSKTKLEQENIEIKRAKNTVEDQVRNLMDEKESLKKKVDKLEAEVGDLGQIIDNTKEEENRQKDKLARVEQEKKQLEAALREVGDQELDISFAKRALESQLEDAQRNLNKKSQDNQELRERLQMETVQKDLLKKMKNEMENEKRQLEKMVEKLQKEMAEVTKDSQRSNLDLRKELDDCKEKSRTQLTSLQQQLKTKGLEAEKSQLMTKKLQDEIRRLREELEDCSQERDEALLKSQQLRQNVSDLERDLESKVHCVDDRARQVKQIEDKLVDLEMELEEERNNSDLLTDRINRDREQIEQMRSELFQERAARQDVECDKVSLERQHKDLKSRIAYLEGSQKQNKEGIVTQLEARVQELEERLEEEERERSTLQLNNRKLERKAKELMLQTDDERLHLTDQKDQLNLRLKALKRQVDEAEEEIDRLENAKRKLQRELEEQIETNEELQGQMNALKKDLRRKNSVAKVSSSILNDYENDYSTDEDSIYDTDFRSSKDDNL